jgi:cell division septation protein DedD
MHFVSRIIRITLLLALLLGVTFLGAPVAAQGDGGGTDPNGETPPVTEPTVPAAPGVLQLYALTCDDAANAGVLRLYLPGEFVADATCRETTSYVYVDGIDYGPVAPWLELQLAAGYHTVTELTTGVARDVELLSGVATLMTIVTFVAPVVEEPTPTIEPTVEAASEEVVELSFVTHLCAPAIQTADALYSLGSNINRIVECPVITLPGYAPPAGAVNGGQASFDYALSPEVGEPLSLGFASYTASDICESEVGIDLNGNPVDDACYSRSRYDLEIADGFVAVQQTVVPPLTRLGGVETAQPEDGGAITSVDPGSGSFTLDTTLRSSSSRLTVHVYLFVPPQISLSYHVCSPEITTRDVLAALGDVFTQLQSCPAQVAVADGGSLDVDFTVVDGAGSVYGRGSAVYDAGDICELDLRYDFNGVVGDNACISSPRYVIEQVTLGGMTVTTALGSPEQRVGAEAFVPGRGDEATLVGFDESSQTVTLQTGSNGDVWLHLFVLSSQPEPTPTETATAIPSPTATTTPSPTATATASPSATSTRTPTAAATATPTAQVTPAPTQTPRPNQEGGMVQVAALYCLSNVTATTLTALSPGQMASASQLGGSSCFGGDGEFRVLLNGTSSMSSFRLGRDGVETVGPIPATGSGSQHTLVDVFSGRSTSFSVAPGLVTRVIVRIEVAQGGVDAGLPSASGSGNYPDFGVNYPGAAGDAFGGFITDNLITDELVTDDLITNTGSSGFSMGEDDFSKALFADLHGEALSGVDELPGVGSGTAGERLPVTLVTLLALAAVILGWTIRRRPIA